MEGNDDGEDWDLARRAAGGDEAAYAVLIGRYQGPVHGFVFRSVADVETAKDLTQEVFVKAWFALGRVQERARFSTWLFQIAANLCRDHAKSKAARNSRMTNSMVRERDDGSTEERDFVHPGLPPDEQAQTNETIVALHRAIAALPVDLREAFILGAIDQLPHKESSSILGISPKAVEVRIYRARKALAERLSSEGFDAG
ncbi:MAG: RNA polymerase sigma factor [Verrucomicrobiota bacterium]